MTIKNLANTSFDQILDCFLLAFENYFVTMPTSKDYYRERWKASKVDFRLSYGMFADDTLVGFILHSVDFRNGVLTAYNSGTGVIPDHRGKGIVQSIYNHALQDLADNKIERSTLEVITKNERAIRCYEHVGFKKSKTYKCYSGDINVEAVEFELEKIELTDINWMQLPHQQFYSWDNQKESILAGDYSFYKVLCNEVFESYFIIKPNSGYIAQFDILEKNEDSWHRLFSAIKSIAPTIKINNVDTRLTEKIEHLNQFGLTNFIDQYEMELDL